MKKVRKEMPKQSGFLKKQQEKEDAALMMGIQIGVQYAIDTLNISMNEGPGWGYDRQMNLMEIWRKNRQFYKPSLDFRDVECDVYREKMDKAIKKIVSDKGEFYPFEERYPSLKKVRYTK